MGLLSKIGNTVSSAVEGVKDKLNDNKGDEGPDAAAGEVDAYLVAKAENCALLQLLDDVLAGEMGSGVASAEKIPKGLGEKVTFAHGNDDAAAALDALYTGRRGNTARMRASMNALAEGVLGKASDAIHNSKVGNVMQSRLGILGTSAKAAIVDAVQGGPGDAAPNEQEAAAAQALAEAEVTQVDLDIFGVPEKSSSLGNFQCKFNAVGYTEKDIAAAFGTDDFREKMFPGLGRGYLNAAATGCVPESVRLARRAWNVQYQLNPVVFRFVNLATAVRQAELAVANMLRLDPEDLVFCLGAEQGVSTVLRSLPWRPGDAVLYIDNVSAAVKHAIRSLFHRSGVEVVRVAPSAYPYGAGTLQSQLKKVISDVGAERIRCCVVAEVDAYSGVHLDVGALTGFLHKQKISVLCDGTLAVGQRGEVCNGCDWYTASLNPWCYTEAGAGILVTQPGKQITTQTLTVSYFDRGCASKNSYTQSYLREFSYSGLQDFSNWLSVRQALKFTDFCKWKNIRAYTTQLAKDVVEAVNKLWGTTPVQESGKWGSMPVFPLPKGRDEKYNAVVAAALTSYLSTTPCRDNTSAAGAAPCCVHVSSLVIDGMNTLCARFTCQIFNTLDEYTVAAKFIQSLYPYHNVNLNPTVDPRLAVTFN